MISATHRDLDRMVREGTFRQDLLFRLEVLRLDVPPLRERTEDILPLARVFLERACAQTGRDKARLSAAAQTALMAEPWTGNVRQLQNVIFRAVALSEGPVIDVGALDLKGGPRPAAEAGAAETLEAAVEQFEKALLERLYPQYPSTRKLAEPVGHLAFRRRRTASALWDRCPGGRRERPCRRR